MGGFTSLQFPALAIKPPESPLQQFGQVEDILARRQQIQGEAQRQEMGDVELQNARLAQQSNQTLMGLLAKNNGDLNQTYADALDSGKVLPDHLLDFRTKSVAAQTAMSTLQEKDLANLGKIHDLAFNELESIRSLPVEQRTPDAVKASMQRLSDGGVDISKMMPVFQSVVNDPSDANLKTLETGLNVEKWLKTNEDQQRLASMPTVQQAQARNVADLNKAVSDSLIAQRQYDNMPSRTEAASTRAAEFLKTQSETAKNNAETANARLDAKMKGVKLVYAVDAQGQMNLLPIGSANAAGMKVYQEAPSDAYANEKKSAIELGSVQSAISEYRAAGNDPRLRSDSAQDKAAAAILSDNKILGTLGDKVPFGARMSDVATAMQNASHWNELDPEHQKLVAGYLTAKISAANMQKLQGGSIGRNQEIIHAEFGAVPTPLQAGSPSFNQQVDAFQTRLNVASQGSVKVPGVRTPQDIKADVEARIAAQAAAEGQASEVFRRNRAAQAGQPGSVSPQIPQFRPPISTGTGPG